MAIDHVTVKYYMVIQLKRQISFYRNENTLDTLLCLKTSFSFYSHAYWGNSVTHSNIKSSKNCKKMLTKEQRSTLSFQFK